MRRCWDGDELPLLAPQIRCPSYTPQQDFVEAGQDAAAIYTRAEPDGDSEEGDAGSPPGAAPEAPLGAARALAHWVGSGAGVAESGVPREWGP